MEFPEELKYTEEHEWVLVCLLYTSDAADE